MIPIHRPQTQSFRDLFM